MEERRGLEKPSGLTPSRLVNALGIAGSHAGGLMEFAREGAMTKRIHVGRGSQMGLESALLAARGFTGPSTVLEGDRGFLRVYSPSPRPELLLQDLGEEYVLLDMTVKSYACHASFHPVIESVRNFRQEQQVDVGVPESIVVVGTERMVERHGQREPTSVLGAQYSLPFSVAIALCRDIADPLAYSERTLWDTQVREVAKAVELAVDGDRFGVPGGPVAEVSLTVAGRTHTLAATGWQGAPGNPYTLDQMADKFRRYASPCLPPARIEEIIRKTRTLDVLDDVADLAVLLRAE